MSFIGFSVSSLWSLKTLCIGLLLLNLKSLPLMWFARFLRIFVRRLTDTGPRKHLSPRCLFLPAISSSRSPALECDHNLHKSNSTYFTDMDMSRGNFTLTFFGEPFNPFPGPTHFTMILGATSCTWRKEIKPYQPYEVWTRILSWDEKWLYIVTHFVAAHTFRPSEYVMQPKKNSHKVSDHNAINEPLKAVFASSVARYVFKNNRKTVPPKEVLVMCGLLEQDGEAYAKTEAMRLKALPVARMEAGWDAVHDSFEPGLSALGHYSSVY